MLKERSDIMTIERDRITNALIKDYEQYVYELDDDDLKDIWKSGCFTLGSMNYFKELDAQVKGDK